MNTFLFDLDDTLLKLNWPEFEKAYYGGLASAFAHLIPAEQVASYIYKSYLYMLEAKDGRTNKEKFYDKMSELAQISATTLSAEESAYYLNEYDKLQGITAAIPDMVASVRLLLEKSYPIIIASQPVFPAIATHKRLAWLGFSPADFLKVTSFETASACKPDLQYYRNLLEECNLEATSCIMVGNDVKEDMVATVLGIKGILITDGMIDSPSEFTYERMSAKEFLEYAKRL